MRQLETYENNLKIRINYTKKGNKNRLLNKMKAINRKTSLYILSYKQRK